MSSCTGVFVYGRAMLLFFDLLTFYMFKSADMNL